MRTYVFPNIFNFTLIKTIEVFCSNNKNTDITVLQLDEATLIAKNYFTFPRTYLVYLSRLPI